METSTDRRPLEPGDRAPDFTLPAVNREGLVSLDDYRGRNPVLVGLFRGLHCPFCRRQVVQFGTTQDRLQSSGVKTLAIVNTPLERARLYFRYRPARVLLAADPDVATHRAFGVPEIAIVEPGSGASHWPYSATMDELLAVRVNLEGMLPEPKNVFEAMDLINPRDGFAPTSEDQQVAATHGTQLVGHFLIDREGIVRWAHVEAKDRPEDVWRAPSEDEIVDAAAKLT
jgi:peroxiredoxin